MSAYDERKLKIIGAPVGAGGGHQGSELGPAALRAAGILKRLETLGFHASDLGDVVQPIFHDFVANTKISNHKAIAGWSRALSESTYSALCAGEMPIVLGGDHSVSIGSINGVARFYQEQGQPLFVLWIDAHADFNTPEITPTGNAHGMSAAHLCGEPGMDDFLGCGERYTIPPKHLYLFGTRWIDPEEQLLLGRRGVNVMDVRAVDKHGIPALLESIIDEVRLYNGNLHVSFDLDFLDPQIAPAVGTPEPCGFREREAHLIMEILHDSGLVQSIDLVELNPLLDCRNDCAFILIELLTTLLGRKIMDVRENSRMRSALADSRYAR